METLDYHVIANKLMAKYQRPCCMLTKTVERKYAEDAHGAKLMAFDFVTYQGSARGCDKVGVTEFKDICAATGACDYTIGHQGAFGLGLPQDKIDAFVKSTDEQLANMSSEPIYYVDYIWTSDTADAQAILDIAEFDPYIGKDMDEPLVAIQGIKVTKDNITMMGAGTLKITLPNGINIIKFKSSEEEFQKLYSEYGYIEINIVGKCNANCWNNNVYPQIFLENYEIISSCAYIF